LLQHGDLPHPGPNDGKACDTSLVILSEAENLSLVQVKPAGVGNDAARCCWKRFRHFVVGLAGARLARSWVDLPARSAVLREYIFATLLLFVGLSIELLRFKKQDQAQPRKAHRILPPSARYLTRIMRILV
jgi:hypothetical protein